MSSTKDKNFSAEERAAMRERARELKAEERANKDRAAGESDLLAKIAEMPEPDRSMATRLHAIVMAAAPSLAPRTWYGSPAYAKDGQVVCFFQNSQKFNTRLPSTSIQASAGEPMTRGEISKFESLRRCISSWIKLNLSGMICPPSEPKGLEGL